MRKLRSTGICALTMFVKVFAKSLLGGVCHTLEKQIERVLSSTDGTHAVVDAARSGEGK